MTSTTIDSLARPQAFRRKAVIVGLVVIGGIVGIIGLFAMRRPAVPRRLDLSAVRTLSAARAAEIASFPGTIELGGV
ncbi:MAG: hypothetical protein ACKO6B_14615, partial [Planctomycetia bacterium]